jgi:hypothetical protein
VSPHNCEVPQLDLIYRVRNFFPSAYLFTYRLLGDYYNLCVFFDRHGHCLFLWAVGKIDRTDEKGNGKNL